MFKEDLEFVVKLSRGLNRHFTYFFCSYATLEVCMSVGMSVCLKEHYISEKFLYVFKAFKKLKITLHLGILSRLKYGEKIRERSVLKYALSL